MGKRISLWFFLVYLCFHHDKHEIKNTMLSFFKLKNVSASLNAYEGRLRETEEEHSTDLESSLIRLEEEQQRFVNLIVNIFVFVDKYIVTVIK